jgi:hypothetical protein
MLGAGTSRGGAAVDAPASSCRGGSLDEDVEAAKLAETSEVVLLPLLGGDGSSASKPICPTDDASGCTGTDGIGVRGGRPMRLSYSARAESLVSTCRASSRRSLSSLARALSTSPYSDI